MSLLPPSVHATLRRETGALLVLLSLWTTASGGVMLANSRVLNREPGWQPAQFAGRVSLGSYGFVFVLCGALLFSSMIWPGWWRGGLLGSFVACGLSLFLAITLVVEAARTGVGWLFAVNFVFDAGCLALSFRIIKHEHEHHPTGRP